MIKTKVYLHYAQWELDKYIEKYLDRGYTLLSCSTKDIFWSFSCYTKESTLVFKKK